MGADNAKVVLEAAESLGQPTVNELVGYLTKHCGLKFNDAAREVYVQYKRGALNLQDANPKSGFGSYLFNVENAWFWGVSVLVAVSFAVVFGECFCAALCAVCFRWGFVLFCLVICLFLLCIRVVAS